MGYIFNITTIFIAICIIGCVSFQYIDSINDIVLIGLNYQKLYQNMMDNNYCVASCDKFLNKIKYHKTSLKNMEWDTDKICYVT